MKKKKPKRALLLMRMWTFERPVDHPDVEAAAFHVVLENIKAFRMCTP